MSLRTDKFYVTVGPHVHFPDTHPVQPHILVPHSDRAGLTRMAVSMEGLIKGAANRHTRSQRWRWSGRDEMDDIKRV